MAIGISINMSWEWLLLLILFGLCIGSFLNLTAIRLPMMLEQSYRKAAKDTLLILPEMTDAQAVSLIAPRSRCPNCQHQLLAIDLIPILSYLHLRRRCRHCQQLISAQYPCVELLATVIIVLPFYFLPETNQAIAAAIAGCLLLLMAIIDLDRQWLPDSLTLPLLWLGLLVNCYSVFNSPQQAIIGAIAGYLSLWLLLTGFKLITGKIGIGGGDLKLLAAAGAWLGWKMLPGVLLIAAITGLMFVALLIVTKGYKSNQPIAFGPWLALGFWLHLLLGSKLVMA